jgi:hypothetical protein
MGPVHAPESFHGQILRSCRIADNAHDLAIDFTLVLAEERFEGLEIARRQSLQQVHAPPCIYHYCAGSPDVTSFLGEFGALGGGRYARDSLTPEGVSYRSEADIKDQRYIEE